MSSPEEFVPSIGRHEEWWRNDDAASQRDADDDAEALRQARRLPQEQALSNSTEQSAEQRLSSAA